MALCKRCGGSGRYSYHPVHGTRCFRCSGSGEDPSERNRDIQNATQLVLGLPADRKAGWLAVMEQQEQIGVPFGKADCPDHGEYAQLNKNGQCSQCCLDRTRELLVPQAA